MLRATCLALLTLVPSAAASQTLLRPLDVTTSSFVDPERDLAEINTNDAETEGWEVNGSLHLTPRWVLSGGWTYGAISTDPRYRWRVAMDYSLTDRLSFGSSFLHVTSRSGLDADGARLSTPAYTVVSATARYAINRHVSIKLIGYNLANVPYYDGLGIDGAPNRRSVRGVVSFNY